MKLALTLSKEERFQRSKNIMKHQTSNLSNTKSQSKVDQMSRNGKTKSAAGRDSDAEHSTHSSRIIGNGFVNQFIYQLQQFRPGPSLDFQPAATAQN